MKEKLVGLFSSLLLGLGFISLISPVLLYWFIHGDYDRYVWIINGPEPFSSFGGGPFQLALSAGLIFIGFILIGLWVLTGKSK